MPTAKLAAAVVADAENSEAAHLDLLDEIRRLQKTQALLIAVQFAANHEAQFDLSDAVAGILLLVDQTLDGLNLVEALR